MALKGGVIRPLALCVIRRGDAMLVFEGHDRVKGTTFYRPLGGGIEFGERGHETVAREFREELDAAVVHLRYLGLLENIFRFEDTAGHEIALIYEGEFADASLYDRDEMVAHEPGDLSWRVLWLPLAEARAGRALLYPDGLLELLDHAPPRNAPAAGTD